MTEVTPDNAAKTVTRYNISFTGRPQDVYYSTDGEWVKYSDHSATVTALEARISDAVWRIDNEASQFIDAEGMTYLKYIRDLLTGAGAK